MVSRSQPGSHEPGKSLHGQCCFNTLPPAPPPPPPPTPPPPHPVVEGTWSIGWANAGGDCKDTNGTYTIQKTESSTTVASCTTGDGDHWKLECSYSASRGILDTFDRGSYMQDPGGCEDFSLYCPKGKCSIVTPGSIAGKMIDGGTCCWS